MNDNLSTNEVFIQYGGSLLIETIENQDIQLLFSFYGSIFRGWIDLSAKYEGPKLPFGNVFFDFIDSCECNALAIKNRENEYVGIYFGMVLAVTVYCNAFMSDPQVFDNIGSSKNEVQNPNTIEMLKGSSINLELQIPKDSLRQLAARQMADNILTAIFYHELGHITRCHLPFLHGEFNMTEIREFGAMPLTYEVASILRALEFDADRAASQTSLITFSKLIRNGKFKNLHKYDPIVLWIGSITMMFCILDVVGGRTTNNNKLSSHPPIWVRFYNIIEEVLSNDILSIDEMKVNQGMAEVLKWFKRNGFFLNHKDQSSQIVNDLMELSSEYNKINDKLIEYQLRRKRMQI
ncbi:hypothetical protein KA005_09900 [bacterium]|nr:hypothetical protein [bacterium]